MQLAINVVNKIARADQDYKIVCGNSDYIVNFTFDSEWDAHDIKTARFAFTSNGESKYVDVVFTGNICEIPILSNITAVEIGVFSGELRTTTPCILACEKSILCKDGAPEAPAEDVYSQIVELCNETVETAKQVEAKATELEKKVNEAVAIEIVQETGDSEIKVMSQKAVTEMSADFTAQVNNLGGYVESVIIGKENRLNKINDFSKIDIFSDEQYPTAKLVQQYVQDRTLEMHQYCQEVTDEKITQALGDIETLLGGI